MAKQTGTAARAHVELDAANTAVAALLSDGSDAELAAAYLRRAQAWHGIARFLPREAHRHFEMAVYSAAVADEADARRYQRYAEQNTKETE